jgi:lysophospholipase L1-like esterase
MATRSKRKSSSKATGKAHATGVAMARKALAERQRGRKTRALAIAALPAPATRRTLAKGTLAAKPGPSRATSAGTLIAEGDSWFDYPFFDVLKSLEDDHGFDVESVAHKGDTVEDMAFGGGQLDDFTRRIDKVLRRGEQVRAILLSGGGNDIAGPEFAILLNHARSNASGLNRKIVEGVIEERLFDAYVTILGAVTEVCTVLSGAPIRIVLHGYDYPIPDGRGFGGGWGPLPGPWLSPGLVQKGYNALPQGKPILIELIDRFNAMLRRAAQSPGMGHVKYVDLRGELPSGSSYKDWWANELHPSRKGFQRVATRIAAAV